MLAHEQYNSSFHSTASLTILPQRSVPITPIVGNFHSLSANMLRDYYLNFVDYCWSDYRDSSGKTSSYTLELIRP